MSATAPLKLPAPAKINLFLHVTGRRSDGYHSVETLLVPLDYCDWITLSLRPAREITRSRGPAAVPVDDDLAVRAARLLQRRCGVEHGVDIELEKRIPIGGGLGGGSSDAATVLLGLNRLWGLGLDRRALMSFALELGVDVPFFVFGAPAFAHGIGERLESFSLPATWFVILAPRAQASTARIFAAPELTRQTPSAKIPAFSEAYGGNDLQAVAVSRFPGIADQLAALSRAAPQGIRVAMSGSGASVFAAFAEEEAAVESLSRATRAGEIEGFVARALNRHPLHQFAAS
ncbi:MAG TPA: 4-(cytidine 5'-diphospho)-2-C-methyl-D-erythritol kinase [Casimicrobiaceae bacterium]|nr:4-(cytidine 5'-diphospho)-2-C-methyl-D-erythritol kinase [Casimicrobiaceae bacterium]